MLQITKGPTLQDAQIPFAWVEVRYPDKESWDEERISGIVVTIHTSEGREVVKDFTLTELKQKVTAARAKQADPESLVVGLKIEKGCKIGFVTDVKQVLREASALKITYNSTDG